MRFKLDENLPVGLAAAFTAAGFDAATVADEGLGGARDSRIAAVCQVEDRVLVTLDLGFADIRSYPPGEHKGIIVLRPRSQDRATLQGLVARLIRALSSHNPRACLWIVDEERVRVRESREEMPGR